LQLKAFANSIRSCRRWLNPGKQRAQRSIKSCRYSIQGQYGHIANAALNVTYVCAVHERFTGQLFLRIAQFDATLGNRLTEPDQELFAFRMSSHDLFSLQLIVSVYVILFGSRLNLPKKGDFVFTI
jgi:hypothetical protein